MLIRSHKNNLYVFSLLQEWTHWLLNNMLDLTAIPNNPLLWWVLRQTFISTSPHSPRLPKIISIILSIGCRQETEELKFHLTTWPPEVMRGCKSKQTENKVNNEVQYPQCSLLMHVSESWSLFCVAKIYSANQVSENTSSDNHYSKKLVTHLFSSLHSRANRWASLVLSENQIAWVTQPQGIPF